MSDAITKELRVHRAISGVSLLTTITLLLTAFQHSAPSKQRLEEIDVEKLNIVEKDGRIRMTLANLEKLPGPIERGKPFGYGSGTRTGMIFYNEEGTENGGLIFGGKRDSTGKYSAFGSLTFDQYDQDQTIALQYLDDNGRRRSGLAINDYKLGLSSGELDKRIKVIRAIKDSAARADSLRVIRPWFPIERFYAGRGRDAASIVSLSDPQGKTRLRLRVDSTGTASIEFVNTDGSVARRISSDATKNNRF